MEQETTEINVQPADKAKILKIWKVATGTAIFVLVFMLPAPK